MSLSFSIPLFPPLELGHGYWAPIFSEVQWTLVSVWSLTVSMKSDHQNYDESNALSMELMHLLLFYLHRGQNPYWLLRHLQLRHHSTQQLGVQIQRKRVRHLGPQCSQWKHPWNMSPRALKLSRKLSRASQYKTVSARSISEPLYPLERRCLSQCSIWGTIIPGPRTLNILWE